jgi:RNA polymerase sigma-70 factor, ECF subfamily
MFGRTLTLDLLQGTDTLQAVENDREWVLVAMQKHGQELITLLWRILGNEQDVCDIYQSTFLRLAHSKGGCKPAHIKAYVFRTASNTAISLIRRRAAEQRTRDATQQREHYATSPAQEVNQKQLVEQLRFYIAKLPGHLREVVTLRDLAELSYGQISHILGITAASARVYRCKAITLLAAWMSSENVKDYEV